MAASWRSEPRLIAAILAAALAPIVPAVLIFQSRLYFGQINDLPEYYASARMMLSGQGAGIYDLALLAAAQHELFPEMGQRVVGLYVPPFSAPLLVPVGLLPAGAAYAVWTSVLVSALVLSVFFLRAAFGLSVVQTLWLFAVLSLSGPAFESVRIGQLAPLLLLALSGALLALKGDRPLLAGFLLGVLLLKPQQLAPMVAYLLGCRRYRPLIGLVASGIVLVVLSLPLLGPAGYDNYWRLVSGSVEHTFSMQPELNPTARGQLLRIFPEAKGAVTLLAGALSICSLAGIAALGARLRQASWWLEAGLIAAVPLGLVTSLHCHDYDLLLLVPTVAALARSALRLNLPRWLPPAGMLVLAPYLLPFYTIVHNDYLLKAGGILNPMFVSLLATAVTLLAIAAGKSAPGENGV
jgi:hypothetical protein